MTARLTSTRFVGRTAELAELELAAREATSGRPTLVLLGGESGVGKTRLVSEFAHRLTRPEAETAPESQPGSPPPLVLRGEAVEQVDGELPYAPLLGALRPLVRGRHPVFAGLTSGTRLQLATLLPGLEESPRAEERPGSDAADQLRLFEAILALLDALGEQAPVVLVIEDVHWADRSTRSFVAFLARSLRTERVMLLLSYRADELHRRHPLRPLLSELERLDRTRRIDLAPLDRAELREVLADILGAEPGSPLLERLLARGEGNPLYTEELLAAGMDGRGMAPRSLSDAFLQRIERLAPDAQRLARAVSVGRALDEPALAALTGLERSPLQSALREAVNEQVLIPGRDSRFGFRHALLREAVYDDLLPGERGELHMALAQHLEAVGATASDDDALDRAASVASHYAAAGDQPAALRTTVQAAELAGRARAYGEAADLYSRALELWPRVPDPEATATIDHVQLLGRAAMHLSIIDERGRAEAVLAQALDELDPERDPARYAALLGRRARILWSLNRGADAVATAERALTMIPDPRADPSRVRAWLARAQTLRGRFREAVADGEPALQAAVAAGDSVAETELLNTLGMARVGLGDVEPGLELLRRAIVLARENDDTDSLATAHSNLADMLGLAGRPREAVEVAREGLRVTPRTHVRNHDWQTLTLGEHAFAAGDWALAAECLPPPSSRFVGILDMFRELREAELAAGTGDDARALAALARVADPVRDATEPQWIGAYGALAGEVHARQGNLDVAQAVVQEALDRMEVCTDDIARIALISATGLRVEADRAQRARDLAETAARRDALARARLHFTRVEAAAQDGGPVEQARLAQARGELARARGRASARQWLAAAAAWEAIDQPYPVAIARWRAAECHVAGGDREAAIAVAGQALEVAHALGSTWLEREIRGLGERARLGLDHDPSAPVAPEAAAPQDPFGLTARERQVLALVAQGATNRQIGASLYMAEKTASVHVSRILAKLDVQGRTEAAAVAHRLHLT